MRQVKELENVGFEVTKVEALSDYVSRETKSREDKRKHLEAIAQGKSAFPLYEVIDCVNGENEKVSISCYYEAIVMPSPHYENDTDTIGYHCAYTVVSKEQGTTLQRYLGSFEASDEGLMACVETFDINVVELQDMYGITLSNYYEEKSKPIVCDIQHKPVQNIEPKADYVQTSLF